MTPRQILDENKLLTIAGAIILTLIALLSWFAQTNYAQMNERVASVQNALPTKVTVTNYDKDMDANQKAHAAIINTMATKDDMKKVEERVTQILTIMLDPTKIDKVRADVKKSNKVK